LFVFEDDFVIYSVEGKGGLRRHVAVPVHLADKLETYRLPGGGQIVKRDRKIDYTTRYDLASGQAFSQSFSTASKKALGFSTGAHGLRHSYAQRRLKILKKNGLDTKTAMSILSQELGHFRSGIVLAYLRESDK
jgi:integrase